LNPLQNGVGRSATATFLLTPTAASIVSGTVTAGRQDAKIPSYAFNSRQFGVSYTREFVGGITAGVSPTFTTIDYDAALAAFSVARRDRQYAVQVSLLERKIDFHGLTPRL